MLRHAHFYMKGGKRSFAALCIEVCCAGPSCHLWNYKNLQETTLRQFCANQGDARRSGWLQK
jgi:hypothetical protein